MDIDKYLMDLENRIDEEAEEKLYQEWKDFNDNKAEGAVFSPKRIRKSPSSLLWPAVPVNDTTDNFELMALQQFGKCSEILDKGSGALLCVRCNYGSSIMMSLFGAEMFYMDTDKSPDTLPTSRPIPGGSDGMRQLIENGVPDICGGLGSKVFQMGRYFRDIMQAYPRINKFVHVYHPDLQGPMDICEVLWGSGIFTDIVDMPDLVHKMIDLISQTYIKFLKEWYIIFPPEGSYSVHWSMLHKGRIMLRDDSAMNFSPAMYDEFIKPYDKRLLDEFGGGAVHFCGRGDHYIESASQMGNLYAVNLSQPGYNDMDKIIRNTVDKGIKIIGLDRRGVVPDVLCSRNKRYPEVHCW